MPSPSPKQVGCAVYRGRVLAGSEFENLSRNEVWGEVERRRSGVREGGGRAWEAARIALPRKSR
jgi:hypothetical protein